MRKDKLIIGTLFTISATLVISFATTVAWYERSNRLQVTNIEISFRGEKDLLISSTPDNFRESINDFDYDFEYKPVSSMFSSSWLESKETMPKFRNSYEDVKITEEESYTQSSLASEGYFQTELYLYSSSNIYASIAPETSFVPDEERNRAKADQIYSENLGYTKEELVEKLNKVTDALRVSILDPDEESYSYTIIDPKKKDEETYFCGKLDLDKDGYYDFAKIDGTTKEIIYGEYQSKDKIIYDDYSDTDSDYKEEGERSAFNARTKRNVDSFNFERSVENGFVPVKENSIKLENANSSLLIPVKAREAKKIVLSIYLEGWDTDNIDSTVAGSFLADISFNIGRDMVVSL
ncbi:MAG: hypothetical protein IJ186_06120 [Bacilli bacterium]|nr:hypothetical protein [Bacilli bacterium]